MPLLRHVRSPEISNTCAQCGFLYSKTRRYLIEHRLSRSTSIHDLFIETIEQRGCQRRRARPYTRVVSNDDFQEILTYFKKRDFRFSNHILKNFYFIISRLNIVAHLCPCSLLCGSFIRFKGQLFLPLQHSDIIHLKTDQLFLFLSTSFEVKEKVIHKISYPFLLGQRNRE